MPPGQSWPGPGGDFPYKLAIAIRSAPHGSLCLMSTEMLPASVCAQSVTNAHCPPPRSGGLHYRHKLPGDLGTAHNSWRNPTRLKNKLYQVPLARDRADSVTTPPVCLWLYGLMPRAQPEFSIQSIRTGEGGGMPSLCTEVFWSFKAAFQGC